MKLDLFKEIASSLRIEIGKTESMSSWHTRIAYSAAGRIAMTSLWDSTEDENSDGISITHFKHKVIRELKAFCEMEEEIKFFSDHEEDFIKDIADEIYRIYLNTGYFYHKNYVIYPAPDRFTTYEQITLVRGSALQESINMSGLGFYTLSLNNKNKYFQVGSICEMFNISSLNLEQIWHKIISRYEPLTHMSLDNMEYLSLSPNYSCYWSSVPEKINNISLLRNKQCENRCYYLCKSSSECVLYCKLPDFLVQNREYLQIANCLLNESQNLPSSKYKEDGDIVYLYICYLYPPSILNFIKLYSWPYMKISNDFERIVNKEIFELIKSVLKPLGYSFTKIKE